VDTADATGYGSMIRRAPKLAYAVQKLSVSSFAAGIVLLPLKQIQNHETNIVLTARLPIIYVAR
jgi:hypothetical protein